jgi:transposase
MVRNSEQKRAEVGFWRKQGKSKIEVGRLMGKSQCFVNRWWDAGENGEPYHDKPRSGRPKKLDRTLQAKAVKLATGKRRMKSRQIARELSVQVAGGVSQMTVLRALHRAGLAPYRKRPRPPLTDTHKAKRLKFAKAHVKDDFSNSVFLDEKKWQPYAKGNRKNDVFWAYSADQVPNMKVLAQAPSFNTIGAITIHGPLPMVIVEGTINKDTFQEKLASTILPAAQSKFHGGDYRVIQDNAPPHRAHSSQQFLRDHAPNFISASEFPPYSPDLDVVDNLWATVLARVQRKECPNKEQLKIVVLKEWKSVTPAECEKLILSMNQRLQAVKKAGGGSTKY